MLRIFTNQLPSTEGKLTRSGFHLIKRCGHIYIDFASDLDPGLTKIPSELIEAATIRMERVVSGKITAGLYRRTGKTAAKATVEVNGANDDSLLYTVAISSRTVAGALALRDDIMSGRKKPYQSWEN